MHSALDGDLVERETGVEVVEADYETVEQLLDARAHDELGMSGVEFRAALGAGRFDGQDSPALHSLMGIASLLT